MEVRIRKGYMARRGFNKAEDYFETLTKLSGQWVKVGRLYERIKDSVPANVHGNVNM